MQGDPYGRVFPIGSTVRVAVAVAGMHAGSEGIYLATVGTDHAIVSFWDGGPIRVPLEALEPVVPKQASR